VLRTDPRLYLGRVIILSPADYRDAWDVICSWYDERDQDQIIAAVEDRGQLASFTVAWIKLLAMIATELHVEEGLVKQFARVGVGFDIIPQLKARTEEMLQTLEPKFDPTRLGAQGLLGPMPEKYTFKEYLSDTTGLGSA
jgi:hypothetical protein